MAVSLSLFPTQEQNNQHLVMVNNDRVVTTSLQVAEKFGKLHKNVIRAIKNLDCSEEFNRLNFEPVEYTDAKGEKRIMYYITRDGFAFLVMGFTGKVAAKFKEAYINAFNEMEDILRSGQENRYALSILKSELAKVNKNLRRAIIVGRLKYGNAYGPAGDIPSSFSLYEQIATSRT